MEDSAIAPLEQVAARYAEIRDERQALTREESSLKQSAMSLMKQYGKTHYKRDGIEITVLHGEDDIKVKVAKIDETDDGTFPEGTE